MKQADGYSFSKVIISGEHSVVYGHPALVASVDRRVKAVVSEGAVTSVLDPLLSLSLAVFEAAYYHSTKNLQLQIHSEVPMQSGMGSSAAVAHAAFKALGQYFDQDLTEQKLMALVDETEKYAHGRASGVDSAIVVKGGLLDFCRRDDKLQIFELTAPAVSDLDFLLIQSGQPVETTRDMVGLVADRQAVDSATSEILSQMGEVTQQLINQVQTVPAILPLLTQNQRLLEDLGVVGVTARTIVREIEALGGVAKITGAGGIKHGSGMILAYHKQLSKLEAYADQRQLLRYKVKLGKKAA